MPRRPKAMPSRIRERKKTVFSMCLVCKASVEQFLADFVRFFVFLQSPRTLESTAPASKNEGSPLHAASRVTHAKEARKTTKNDVGFGRFGCIRRQIGTGCCCLERIRRQGGAGFHRFGRPRRQRRLNVGFGHPSEAPKRHFQSSRLLDGPKPLAETFV